MSCANTSLPWFIDPPRAMLPRGVAKPKFEIQIETKKMNRLCVFHQQLTGAESPNVGTLLGRGPYLYPAAPGVCVLGGSPGRVLSQGGGMGAGPHPGGPVADRGAAAGHRPTTAAARSGASFRSGCAVRVWRLRPGLATAPDDCQHEPASQPVRQRQLRKFSEDVQAGGDLRERVP